jgi:hypothetical protein
MTRERFTTWGVLVIGAVLATGCLQPSLHPLLTPADAVFDERLVGTWRCGSETWRFAPTSEALDNGATFRHYLVNINDGDAGTLRAWIGRLGDHMFINFFPDKEGDTNRNSNSDFFEGPFISVNTFGRLRIERDTVHLDMLDSEWVENAYKGGRIAIGVKAWSGDGVLLTAGTEGLQAFARAHADDDRVFGEHVQLVREGGRQAGECL